MYMGQVGWGCEGMASVQEGPDAEVIGTNMMCQLLHGLASWKT